MKKYKPLPASLFVENRKRFCQLLEPNSMAIFMANELFLKNADATYTFKQNSNLYYLTGIDQEETILILYPNHPNPDLREVLFIRKTNKEIEIWEGHKYTQEEARATSGIENVQWTEQLDAFLYPMLHLCENVYWDFNEHDRDSAKSITKTHYFAQKIRTLYPAHTYKRSAPILNRLRMIKSEPEIEAIKKAIEITEKAFRRVIKFIKPGVTEYEIEAEIIHEFIRNRADGHAYDPIIATGKNACILHYVANYQTCQAGEVLLMDFGACYAHYNADLTRCLPVSGRFTKRQKEVYNAVLSVMKQAKTLLKVGNTIDKYHEQVGEIMTEKLLELGLLTSDQVKHQNPKYPAYKKYFMHGTSHHLGLDVHDANYKYEPMQAGYVYTCEPGIYIPEEGLGIRLENNILITQNGNIDLMATIPLEVEEIEALMNEH
ncbi:MAG: aminopeptidase P N-terminal domain-containing protein [Bacteroidia bacterium]|nr:aminopeptidase P N-terminal domain-containing protein [Bacteroidia bacterium]MDW8348538.1 aminopeptidase P N-terminal domain-containing protein [Bacteroidia bacterium]